MSVNRNVTVPVGSTVIPKSLAGRGGWQEGWSPRRGRYPGSVAGMGGQVSQTTGPLGSVQTWRLKLVRARNVTIRTDPSIRQPYRARFEGAPPKVLVQAGVVTVDYGVRRLPRGRRASE